MTQINEYEIEDEVEEIEDDFDDECFDEDCE